MQPPNIKAVRTAPCPMRNTRQKGTEVPQYGQQPQGCSTAAVGRQGTEGWIIRLGTAACCKSGVDPCRQGVATTRTDLENEIFGPALQIHSALTGQCDSSGGMISMAFDGRKWSIACFGCYLARGRCSAQMRQT